MSEQLTDRAVQIGRRIVERFHEAVMAGDEPAIEAGRRHYDRLLCAINGGTTFGCRAGKDSPACFSKTHWLRLMENPPSGGSRAGCSLW